MDSASQSDRDRKSNHTIERQAKVGCCQILKVVRKQELAYYERHQVIRFTLSSYLDWMGPNQA